MADPITFESIGVCMSTHPEEPRDRPQAETPFKILIMGDFSGRSSRGERADGSDIDRLKLYRVDRDNDEAVMEKLGVSVCLPAVAGQAPPVELAFEEMDDFHPEQIYIRTPVFKALKETRRQLMDPDTAAEMIARLSGGQADKNNKAAQPTGKAPAAPGIDLSGETTAGLLDQVLDASSSSPSETGQSILQTDWDRFLGDIVGPHLVPDITDEQDAMVAAIDHSISGTMRRILHHPDFQAVESAWRALRFCLRRMETDETLMVYLLDVTQAELALDLTAHEDLRDTALYKKLSSSALQHSGEAPWSLLAGLYTFAPQKEDAVTLARLGALGQQLGAPFVGGGDAGLVGCPSLYESPDPSEWNLDVDPAGARAWQVIRTLPEAKWVGLALPRFLIRMPYGEDTDPVDAFDFEEMPDPEDHEAYLWAHPVFAMVQIFGRTFTNHGWNWSRGLAGDVDGLPLHIYNDRGQRTVKPCAEAFVSGKALEILVAGGLMPLVAFKDAGRVRLVRFQSIADPPSLLSGPWAK